MNCEICMEKLSAIPGSDAGQPPKKRAKPSMFGFGPSLPGDDSNVCCTPCGHLFHRKCLESWVVKKAKEVKSRRVNSGSCPHCRCQIDTRDLYPVFLPSMDGDAGSKQADHGLELLRKDCMDIREKYLMERERADLAEAKIKSLEDMIKKGEAESQQKSETEPAAPTPFPIEVEENLTRDTDVIVEVNQLNNNSK